MSFAEFCLSDTKNHEEFELDVCLSLAFPGGDSGPEGQPPVVCRAAWQDALASLGGSDLNAVLLQNTALRGAVKPHRA